MDIRLYDIVKLTKAVDQLPRGAQGTVVDEAGELVTLEFLNAHGETLALLDVPVTDTSLVERSHIPA